MIAEPYICIRGNKKGDIYTLLKDEYEELWRPYQDVTTVRLSYCKNVDMGCDWQPYADFEREKLRELGSRSGITRGTAGYCLSKKCDRLFDTAYMSKDMGYSTEQYEQDSESSRLLKRAEFLKAVCEKEGISWLPKDEPAREAKEEFHKAQPEYLKDLPTITMPCQCYAEQAHLGYGCLCSCHKPQNTDCLEKPFWERNRLGSDDSNLLVYTTKDGEGIGGCNATPCPVGGADATPHYSQKESIEDTMYKSDFKCGNCGHPKTDLQKQFDQKCKNCGLRDWDIEKHQNTGCSHDMLYSLSVNDRKGYECRRCFELFYEPQQANHSGCQDKTDCSQCETCKAQELHDYITDDKPKPGSQGKKQECKHGFPFCISYDCKQEEPEREWYTKAEIDDMFQAKRQISEIAAQLRYHGEMEFRRDLFSALEKVAELELSKNDVKYLRKNHLPKGL